MIVYLDSSALVKMYVQEPGTDVVHALVLRSATCATSSIAYAETRAALARRHREGFIRTPEMAQIKTALLDDWQRLFVVPASLAIARLAGDLAESHALRDMDAVHLATALWLQEQQPAPLTFAAWDARLLQAASNAGLAVEGP